MDKTKCPICDVPAIWRSIHLTPFAHHIQCPRCGDFFIDRAIYEMGSWTVQQRTNLSGWIRENKDYEVYSSNLEMLQNLRNLNFSEKAEKLLEFLEFKYPRLGQDLDVSDDFFLELEAVSRSIDRSELNFLIYDYLLKEKGFILFVGSRGAVIGGASVFKITPAGWAHIDSKRQSNPNSQIGFVAMWFDKSVDSAHLAIEMGIRDAGYDPLRIDQTEHNNKIDDEVVAGIRRSKFLVADFTGHRGGVYFEAGLAMGLGLPVIWLCRKDEVEKIHVDTRQYNFIEWETNALAALSKALQNRIEATIGRGPLIQNSVV